MTPLSPHLLPPLFRGLFLHYLEKAYAAGGLHFFSAQRHLQEPGITALSRARAYCRPNTGWWASISRRNGLKHSTIRSPYGMSRASYAQLAGH